MKTLLLLVLIPSVVVHAQDSDPANSAPDKLPVEKELDVIDFKNVKDVLKKDGLDAEVKKKQEAAKRASEMRVAAEKSRQTWPSEDDFWPLAAEWWLVKNAPTLSWDFDRPEYGLEPVLAQVLRTVGFMQKRFRVLALGATSPAHLSLPADRDGYILLFSVPFVRAMDLSKLEIALLLLEDVLRSEEGWLREQVRPAKLKDLAGSSFVGRAPDLSPLTEVGAGYTAFLKNKGFTFQQQFAITKKMDVLLKPHPELWNTYVRLLGKIDRLVKGNAAHADYVKLYPSPEMQIRWLAPEEKTL